MERSGFEGIEPIGGLAEPKKYTEVDIAYLTLHDEHIAVARESLRNDPDKDVVTFGVIPEFDSAVAVKLSTDEYVFYVNESNVIRFTAVCNEAGLITVSKMAEAIGNLERKPELPN